MQVGIIIDVTAEKAAATVGIYPTAPWQYEGRVGTSLSPEDSIAEAKNAIHALSDAVDFAQRVNRSMRGDD